MTKDELVALLERYRIPYKTWLKHSGKSIEHLLVELEKGEAKLVEKQLPTRRGSKKLVREIRTVLVRIYIDLDRDGRIVRHTLEELKRRKDGQWHRRKVQQASISEKMLPEETVHQAILRAFAEELGLARTDTGASITLADLVTLQFHTLPKSRSFDKSGSFPGLYNENRLEFATWVMPKVFYRPEYREHRNGTLTSFFRWHDVARKEATSILYG